MNDDTIFRFVPIDDRSNVDNDDDEDNDDELRVSIVFRSRFV